MIDTVTKNYNPIDNTFCSYRVTYVNSNRVKSVPLDPANTDYQAIMEYIENGGEVIDNGGNE